MSCKLAKRQTLQGPPPDLLEVDMDDLVERHPTQYARWKAQVQAEAFNRGFDAGRQAERQAQEDAGKWEELTDADD